MITTCTTCGKDLEKPKINNKALPHNCFSCRRDRTNKRIKLNDTKRKLLNAVSTK